jgi:nitroimidazol reductase NimA-like FMN-containing flavoprotein (pyridoxamine 5'-phosphate oxidase superfamily)
MSSYYNKTRRVIVRRRAGRGRYDRETIDAILDAGMIAHAGLVSDDGHPFVIPVLYARGDDQIYLHGSPLSRLLRTAGEALPMCLTVTLLDGLVLARSAMHHSVNYRSVVVLGDGREVTDEDEKQDALRRIVDQVLRGRADDVRGPSAKELKQTKVVAISIREASAKIRDEPPVDEEDDYALPYWAGQVPLRLVRGEPIPDERCTVPAPDYLPPAA